MPRLELPASILILALFPAVASAHPGHGPTDFGAGLTHPFTGVDHLLAMIAVGWWSAAVQVRRWWVVPAAFASGTLAGTLLGMAGLATPAAELAVPLSLIVLGVLMIQKRILSLPVAACLAGGLALFHGDAHGHLIPASVDSMKWLAGLVTATLLLHLFGASLSTITHRSDRALRMGGAVVAVAGAALIMAPIGV